MIITVLSVILALMDLSVQYVVSHRIKYRWRIALTAQIPWVIYFFCTKQYGLIMLPISYTVVYLGARRKEAVSEC